MPRGIVAMMRVAWAGPASAEDDDFSRPEQSNGRNRPNVDQNASVMPATGSLNSCFSPIEVAAPSLRSTSSLSQS